MNAKTVLKRMASFVLAGAAALSMTVFVGADGAAATATTTPTAASMKENSVYLDGVRSEAEGWTTEPTLIADDQKGDAVSAWLGTDGKYVYVYIEGNYNSFGMYDLQLDFLNQDSGKTETDYRAVLKNEQDTNKIEYSIKLRFHSNTSDYGKAFGFYGSYPYQNIQNDYTELVDKDYHRNHSNVWRATGSSGGKLCVEYSVALPSTTQAALKNGSLTIGADIVGTTHNGWSFNQYETGLVENGVIQITKCRDVVLPQTTNAKTTPVAANMHGKTNSMDGKRTAEEGWTTQPTLVADDVTNKEPIYLWLGTDGSKIYGYSEGSFKETGFFEVCLKFTNTTTGNTQSVHYRFINNLENWTGEGEDKEFCYYGPKHGGPSLASSKGVKNGNFFCYEFAMNLPDYISNGLKNGTVTINADIGATNRNWTGAYYQIESGTTLLYAGEPKDEVLRSVILPSSNVEVIGTQNGVKDNKGAVRFVSALYQDVDYTKYETVGFDVTLNGKTVSQACNMVYDSISANYGATAVTATSQGAKYLFALTVTDLDFDTDYTFTVQPWAKTEGGETVKGVAYTVTVRVAAPSQNTEQASLSAVDSDPVALNLANELAAAQGWTVGEKKTAF